VYSVHVSQLGLRGFTSHFTASSQTPDSPPYCSTTVCRRVVGASKSFCNVVLVKCKLRRPIYCQLHTVHKRSRSLVQRTCRGHADDMQTTCRRALDVVPHLGKIQYCSKKSGDNSIGPPSLAVTGCHRAVICILHQSCCVPVLGSTG
jgi:hypothetical protein